MLAWVVFEGDRLIPWHLADSSRFRGLRQAASVRNATAVPKEAPTVSTSVRVAERSRSYVRR